MPNAHERRRVSVYLSDGAVYLGVPDARASWPGCVGRVVSGRPHRVTGRLFSALGPSFSGV